MVRLKKVSKIYPGRKQAVFREIDLHVHPGQFVYLSGPSGAGKTTLLRLLFGADYPTRGEVRVGGSLVTALDPKMVPLLRRKVGVIFQDFKLVQGLSVFENVALALRVAGRNGNEMVNRVLDSIHQVGLSGLESVRAETLSGGEQQRVAVARALVARPPLLLADEPTGNLDPKNAKLVFSLLTLAHKQGSTVMVATHDPSLLGLVAGARVVHLTGGGLGEVT
jgi:cell division transport system ATP-binding protein